MSCTSSQHYFIYMVYHFFSKDTNRESGNCHLIEFRTFVYQKRHVKNGILQVPTAVLQAIQLALVYF